MNAITLTSTMPTATLEKMVSQAQTLISARHAPATREAYSSDWGQFCAWSAKHGVQSLPASVEAVVLFLSDLATQGIKSASIVRKASAIKFAHRDAGLASPTDMEAVKATLAGIKRTLGTKPRQVAPVTIEVLEVLLATCDNSLNGLRDRALLVVGFGGALRRSELADLSVEQIATNEHGLVLTLGKSKTDQEGKGAEVAVLDGARLEVKKCVAEWLQASGINAGHLFRGIRNDGKVIDKAISTRQIANIIKARAKLAGLNEAMFSGHSLRAGFVTSATSAGADVFRVMDVSRHRKVDTVRGYVRRAEMFKRHAGAGFM
jgi:site-specific recombinase XerD